MNTFILINSLINLFTTSEPLLIIYSNMKLDTFNFNLNYFNPSLPKKNYNHLTEDKSLPPLEAKKDDLSFSLLTDQHPYSRTNRTLDSTSFNTTYPFELGQNVKNIFKSKRKEIKTHALKSNKYTKSAKVFDSLAIHKLNHKDLALALKKAAKNGRVDLVEYYLEDFRLDSEDIESSLLSAISTGQVDVVKLLLQDSRYTSEEIDYTKWEVATRNNTDRVKILG